MFYRMNFLISFFPLQWSEQAQCGDTLSPIVHHLRFWALGISLVRDGSLAQLVRTPTSLSGFPIGVKRGTLLYLGRSGSSRRLGPLFSSGCWRKFTCLSALLGLDSQRAGFSDPCFSLAFGGKSKPPVPIRAFLHVCSTCSPELAELSAHQAGKCPSDFVQRFARNS